MLSNDHLDALVAALLAVNAYSVEKVWAALPAMREAGLLDPAQTVGRDLGEVTVRLAQAGYDRGMLTSLLAGRLQDLLAAVQLGKLDSVAQLVAAGRRSETEALLQTVKGIGPRVANVAWQLLAP
jgi:hypothetical protein